jgi:predicted small secreted protein
MDLCSEDAMREIAESIFPDLNTLGAWIAYDPQHSRPVGNSLFSYTSSLNRTCNFSVIKQEMM